MEQIQSLIDFDISAWKILQRPGWQLYLGRDHFTIEAPTKETAFFFYKTFFSAITQTLKNNALSYANIQAPKAKPYIITKIMTASEPIITLPGLEIGELSLTPALLPWLAHFLENPEIKGGIIRLRDEKQLVLSNAIASILSGGTIKTATKRVRSNFWYLPDLENMRQVTRDAGSNFELDYRCHGSDEHINDWFLNHNRYTHVEDSRGEVYQMFEVLNCQPITAP